MTTANMLSRLRTMLDESSASFWSDTEMYSALADGQREVADHLLMLYKQKYKLNPDEELPVGLRTLVSSTTGTGTQNLPADYWQYLSVYTSSVPVFVRQDGPRKAASRLNTYTASTSAAPFCSFNASQIVFETSVTWTLEYIKIPTAIAVAVQPTLPDITHNAIVQYALCQLLIKDQKVQEANLEYQKFMQMLINLY